MQYLIKLTNGGYLAKSGYKLNYTYNIEEVQVFSTKQLAEKNKSVPDEKIIPLENILNSN